MVDGSEQTCMHARWKGKSDSMCMWRNGHGVNIILVMKISINKQILCIAVHVVRTWCIFIVQNDQVVQLAWVIPCRTYSYHKTPRTTQGWNRVCSSVHSSRDESDKPVDFSVIRLYSLCESSLAGPILPQNSKNHKGWNRIVMAWTEMVFCPDSQWERTYRYGNVATSTPVQQLWSHDH